MKCDILRQEAEQWSGFRWFASELVKIRRKGLCRSVRLKQEKS